LFTAVPPTSKSFEESQPSPPKKGTSIPIDLACFAMLPTV